MKDNKDELRKEKAIFNPIYYLKNIYTILHNSSISSSDLLLKTLNK